MFGLKSFFARRSYENGAQPSSAFEVDVAALNRSAHALSEMFTTPEMRERRARYEAEKRQEEAGKDVVRAALRKGRAALVEELLAELSELERARKASSLSATEHRERVDRAHLEHDHRVYRMIETAIRIYGITIVTSVKLELDL